MNKDDYKLTKLESILEILLSYMHVHTMVNIIFCIATTTVVKYSFLYARQDVLWYGAVRPSVRSVVHISCGRDVG